MSTSMSTTAFPMIIAESEKLYALLVDALFTLSSCTDLDIGESARLLLGVLFWIGVEKG